MFVLQSGRTALFAASNKGTLDIVKLLIDAGATINQIEVGTLYKYIYMHMCNPEHLIFSFNITYLFLTQTISIANRCLCMKVMMMGTKCMCVKYFL